MKANPRSQGFTVVELLLVIAILAIMAAMIPCAPVSAKKKAQRISCVSNLRNVGAAYRGWGSDHSDAFPLTASAEQGGLRELLTNENQGSNCWKVYATMAQQLGYSPKLLVCPADDRRPATNFIVKGATNDLGNADFKDNSTLSYFAGAGATELYPDTILAGDRNLGPGPTPQKDYGFSPANNQGNDVTIQTNSNLSPVCWSLKMHSAGNPVGAGNILLADGSVQQVSSKRFQTDYQPIAGVNPLPSSITQSNQPSHPSFRLIFP